VTRVFTVFPEEYRSWAMEQGIPEPPPGAVRLDDTPTSRGQARLTLLSPQNGQIYKIDPILRRQYQTIRILARIPPNVLDATVHVNGDEETFPYASDATWWQLKRGTYRFQLVGMLNGRKIQSGAVMITVE
jgi:hypothetical protein